MLLIHQILYPDFHLYLGNTLSHFDIYRPIDIRNVFLHCTFPLQIGVILPVIGIIFPLISQYKQLYSPKQTLHKIVK